MILYFKENHSRHGFNKCTKLIPQLVSVFIPKVPVNKNRHLFRSCEKLKITLIVHFLFFVCLLCLFVCLLCLFVWFLTSSLKIGWVMALHCKIWRSYLKKWLKYAHAKFGGPSLKNDQVMPILVFTYKCHTPFEIFTPFFEGGQCELPCKIWRS